MSDHKPLDVIVLLILHNNSYKKPVESLVRNKIRLGKFSETLLEATFTRHGDVSKLCCCILGNTDCDMLKII